MRDVKFWLQSRMRETQSKKKRGEGCGVDTLVLTFLPLFLSVKQFVSGLRIVSKGPEEMFNVQIGGLLNICVVQFYSSGCPLLYFTELLTDYMFGEGTSFIFVISLYLRMEMRIWVISLSWKNLYFLLLIFHFSTFLTRVFLSLFSLNQLYAQFKCSYIISWFHFQVFLEYSDTVGCANARNVLNRRKFGGNIVNAVFYPEDRYYSQDYSA